LPPELKEDIALQIERHKAKEEDRKLVQGLGRPIITCEMDDGYRMVAVSNKVYYSKSWKTFADFLRHFLFDTFEKDWFLAESKKPSKDKHPLIIWIEKTRDFSKKAQTDHTGIYSTHPIGAMRSFINLAYDLYLCAHNWKLPDVLIKRLKKPDLFEGAIYETFVIGCFAKAGFEIEFEDESKGTKKHCEFIAKHVHSGKRFCVEAKAIQGESVAKHNGLIKLHRKISHALKKDAEHPRVVFIELSQPSAVDEKGQPAWVKAALSEIEKAENDQRHDLPPAFLFLTNRPYIHNLDAKAENEVFCSTGFKIFDFPPGRDGMTFADTIHARDKHSEIYDLMMAMNTHTNIPSFFDERFAEEREIPSDLKRLLIGEKYLIPLEDGGEDIGILEQANVLEREKKVIGVYKISNGERVMCSTPISEAELRLYQRSPKTFFGVITQVGRQIETPFDAYDFLANSYLEASREKLLEWMKNWPNHDEFENLNQTNLAKYYCLKMGELLWSRIGPEANNL